MTLDVGDVAPGFALPLKIGDPPILLSDYQGEKPVVLLFFPLAFSSTCTAEMCSVAESYSAWQDLDAEVIGISVDSPFVNQKFADDCNAPFPIVSDFNKEASTAYGVLYDEFAGLRGVSKRSAFVVGRDGRISYAWVSEDPAIMPDFDAIMSALG
ncbi:MAG: peroxiredoxin [Gemmatimonadota bacterium]|nr:MAG: peroxiredoxin [Gemmatimonadota bacterium]